MLGRHFSAMVVTATAAYLVQLCLVCVGARSAGLGSFLVSVRDCVWPTKIKNCCMARTTNTQNSLGRVVSAGVQIGDLESCLIHLVCIGIGVGAVK